MSENIWKRVFSNFLSTFFSPRMFHHQRFLLHPVSAVDLLIIFPEAVVGGDLSQNMERNQRTSQKYNRIIFLFTLTLCGHGAETGDSRTTSRERSREQRWRAALTNPGFIISCISNILWMFLVYWGRDGTRMHDGSLIRGGLISQPAGVTGFAADVLVSQQRLMSGCSIWLLSSNTNSGQHSGGAVGAPTSQIDCIRIGFSVDPISSPCLWVSDLSEFLPTVLKQALMLIHGCRPLLLLFYYYDSFISNSYKMLNCDQLNHLLLMRSSSSSLQVNCCIRRSFIKLS